MQIKPSELNIPRENAVAFTGHRPDRLAWRYNERDPRCRALKKRLQRKQKKRLNQKKPEQKRLMISQRRLTKKSLNPKRIRKKRQILRMKKSNPFRIRF